MKAHNFHLRSRGTLQLILSFTKATFPLYLIHSEEDFHGALSVHSGSNLVPHPSPSLECDAFRRDVPFQRRHFPQQAEFPVSPSSGPVVEWLCRGSVNLSRSLSLVQPLYLGGVSLDRNSRLDAAWKVQLAWHRRHVRGRIQSFLPDYQFRRLGWLEHVSPQRRRAGRVLSCRFAFLSQRPPG